MIYCLIPARSGSRSIPNKNVIKLGDYPVLSYSIAAAKMLKYDCIVTTDSEEYGNISNKYGCNRVIIRPKIVSNDFATDVDYLLHFIYFMNLDYDDVIVLLRPTTPIRRYSTLKKALDYFLSHDIDAMRSMHELNESPAKMFFYCDDGVYVKGCLSDSIDITNNTRQSLKKAYQPNGYIDIVKASVVLKTKTAFGYKIAGFETEKIVELDEMNDFEYLSWLVKEKDIEILQIMRNLYEQKTNS